MILFGLLLHSPLLLLWLQGRYVRRTTPRRPDGCRVVSASAGHRAAMLRVRLVGNPPLPEQIAGALAASSGRAVQWRVTQLHARTGPAPIVPAAVPPMGQFSDLPQPLRTVLGWRAARLDGASRRLDNVLPSHPPLFARDGFHPSGEGYRLWGSEIAKEIPIP